MPLGPFPTRTGWHALVGLRVDPIDAARARARDPDEARSHRDRGRIAVYRDRLHHGPRSRVDARDGAVEVVHDPERLEARSDPPRPRLDGTCCTSRLLPGSIAPAELAVDLCERRSRNPSGRPGTRRSRAPPRAARPAPRQVASSLGGAGRYSAARSSVGIVGATSSAGSCVRMARSSSRSSRPGSTPACSTSSARPSR